MVDRLIKAHPEPVVIPIAVVKEGSVPWRLSLVGTFLDAPFPYVRFKLDLVLFGTPKKIGKCFPMNHGFFIFRFTSSKDKDRALLGGLWVLDDAVLALRPW